LSPQPASLQHHLWRAWRYRISAFLVSIPRPATSPLFPYTTLFRSVVVHPGHDRAADLKVVEVLRVQRGHLPRLPHLLEVFHRRGGGVGRVVPPFERGDGDGFAQDR